MEKRRVTANQPCVFPQIHLFERILTSNVNVNMRTAQFSRQGWQSVYYLKTANHGKFSLTVPVKHYGRWVPIKKAEVAYGDGRWVGKHIRTIEQNYRKAPYFDMVIDSIIRIFMTEWESIGDMALETMLLGYRWLEFNVITVNDDELLPNGRPENPSDWVLAMCKQAKATEYYCGKVASDRYLKYADFKKAKIDVVSQDWECPEYSQLYPPFVGNLSIIDLMMNVLPEEGREVLGVG